MFTDEQQKKITEMIAEEKQRWITEELEPVKIKVKDYKTAIDELEKFKPKILTEEEKKLQEKEIELFNKEKNLILKENGLAEFSGFFNVQKIDELPDSIEEFKKILQEKKVDAGFKPGGKPNNTDSYSQFEKNKDTIGMIKSKLTSLFN